MPCQAYTLKQRSIPFVEPPEQLKVNRIQIGENKGKGSPFGQNIPQTKSFQYFRKTPTCIHNQIGPQHFESPQSDLAKHKKSHFNFGD